MSEPTDVVHAVIEHDVGALHPILTGPNRWAVGEDPVR